MQIVCIACRWSPLNAVVGHGGLAAERKVASAVRNMDMLEVFVPADWVQILLGVDSIAQRHLHQSVSFRPDQRHLHQETLVKWFSQLPLTVA